MKSLPPDDPIFKRGWFVGQTFSGGTPKRKAAKPAPEPSKADEADQDNSMTEKLMPIVDAEIRDNYLNKPKK